MKFKDIKIEDILKERLGINQSAQIKTLLLLLESKKELDIYYLVKKLKKNRTTVLRSLNNLKKYDLIDTQQKNENFGYKYYYSVKNKEKLIKDLKSYIEKKNTKLLKELDKWT